MPGAVAVGADASPQLLYLPKEFLPCQLFNIFVHGQAPCWQLLYFTLFYTVYGLFRQVRTQVSRAGQAGVPTGSETTGATLRLQVKYQVYRFLSKVLIFKFPFY
jgi:hypothetical protein